MVSLATKHYEEGKLLFDSGDYRNAAKSFVHGIQETDRKGWDAAVNFTGLSICHYKQALTLAQKKGVHDSEVIEFITASAREFGAALKADPRIEHFYRDGIPVESPKYDLNYFMEALKKELAGCQKNA